MTRQDDVGLYRMETTCRLMCEDQSRAGQWTSVMV